MSRRKRGSGSIGQRKDGLWFAAVELPRAENGPRRRSVRYASSQGEAEMILSEMTDGAPDRHAVRFWSKVDKVGEGDCWTWVGNRVRGYGWFWNGERRMPAHRWSYEDSIGPIPDGLQIDHLCRNRSCVNPLHLEPVTAKENMRRSWKSRATR